MGITAIYRDAFSGLSKSVWLLSLIMFINRVGAMVVPFLTLYLTKELGFSLPEAGRVMGAYGVGSIAGAYFGGVLTDRYGFYHIQLFSLLGSVVFLIMLTFLTNLYVIMGNVFLLSLVADSLRPANAVAIDTYSKPENKTRSFSLMRFAVNVGFAIGPAMGGIVAQYFGFKWIFIISAVACLLAASILYFVLPYDPAHKPAKVEENISRGLSAYRDYSYIKFILLTSIWAMLFFQLFTSVPVFWSQDFSFSEGLIGKLLGLNGLIIVAIEMPIIRRLEHITQYMKMIALGSVMLIGGFLILGLGKGLVLFGVLYVVLISFAELFAMPFMINYVVTRPAPDRRGQYMALYSMAYGMAFIMAPILSMQSAEVVGFRSTYLILMLISAIVMILFLKLGQENRKEKLKVKSH